MNIEETLIEACYWMTTEQKLFLHEKLRPSPTIEFHENAFHVLCRIWLYENDTIRQECEDKLNEWQNKPFDSVGDLKRFEKRFEKAQKWMTQQQTNVIRSLRSRLRLTNGEVDEVEIMKQIDAQLKEWETKVEEKKRDRTIITRSL